MPTEDLSMAQVPWLYQAVVTVLITLALSLTQCSRNDLLRKVAEGLLSQGALTHDIIKPTETIRVDPHEKAARRLTEENLPAYLPRLNSPNPCTFIPSCKVAKRKGEIWGSPVVIGKFNAGKYELPMVIGMNWK